MILKCSEIAAAFNLKVDRKAGNQDVYFCPNHDDKNASLAINPKKNVWMCGPCGESGGAWTLAHFVLQSTDDSKVVAWLVENGMMEDKDSGRKKGKQVGSYIYKDPDGNEILKIVKYVDNGKKSFIHYRRENGDWKTGSSGIKLYPYRINEWKNLSVIYILEGEKDVDNLWKWNIPATTNPMGANAWKEEYNEFFKDKRVIIIPDNDIAGLDHAKNILANLIKISIGVKLVNLPNLPPKGDFSDWISKCNGTKEEFIKIIRSTPWSTLADAGISADPKAEIKVLVRRVNYDISDFFEKVSPNYDECWTFMKSNENLWSAIKEAEDKLNESCADKDPADIIKARCMEYKTAWKNAIFKFIDEVMNNKNVK
jgi:putative DNA primase/helicase